MTAENKDNTLKAAGIGNSGFGKEAETTQVHHYGRKQQSTASQGKTLLDKILSRENLTSAYRQVVQNKGSGGVDGISVEGLKPLLWENWSRIKQELKEGTYEPKPILRVEIEKPDGGKRKLGIPTVMDRMIQQAISRQLMNIYDRTFSKSSYAYRPGISAHMAIRQAKRYMGSKGQYIICIDLAQFFDRVNHDRLLHRLSTRIEDKQVLRLIRKYLQSGELKDGLCSKQTEGTPQGGPLSPVLSNIVLDELDKELERRGHRFVRYADDISIFVKSRKAAERVYESITGFIENQMKLKVNREKSCISTPENLILLGHGFKKYRGGYQCCVSEKSVRRFREKVKTLTRKTSPLTLDERFEGMTQLFRGWVSYFKLCWMRDKLSRLDNWIRDRIRYCIWKSWKRIRTRIRNLMRLGLNRIDSIRWGSSRKGGWRISKSKIMHVTVTNERLEKRGLPSLVSIYDGITTC
jgi:group II intron reverse transcriptase/maturase